MKYGKGFQIFFIVLLSMGTSIDAFGFLGFGNSVSWKEEVLLHDGSKIIVERSQSYGGRHEVGQSAPIKEQDITFELPGTNKTSTWTSEYSKDVGRANFKLLALHILNGTPYIVASPNLCLSYNKWGRPNPPYVFFKYDGETWQRISLAELPVDFTTINLTIDTKDEEKMLVRQGIVSAKLVRKLNGSLKQPEYRSILREPVELGTEGSSVNCEQLIYYKGAWVGPGDSIGKRMMDHKAK